jgi:endonuclease/exonuclease/phosphatase family metal-dependent hydrolase
MSWVTEKDSQGLKRSMIVDEHVYIEGTNLTLRDKHVVELILQMLSSPTHPRSILTLQECNKPFLKELLARLPENYTIIASHGDAIVIDTNLYGIVSAKNVSGIFSETPSRGFQDVTLQNWLTGKKLRMLNVHLPGDPLHPARFEFAAYLSSTFDPSIATIASGDMNFNEIEMQEALDQAFANERAFDLYSPYCTNISPFAFTSKAIDHYMVYAPEQEVQVNSAEEVMQGLSKTLDLLQPEL